MKTVAVGIPFLASKYTSALELCLNSVKRYLPENLPIPEKDDFYNWLESYTIPKNVISGETECLIGIGTFLRYYSERGKFSGCSLGYMGNPDFSKMEFCYHPEGFVHIEQYDPERYFGNLYNFDLFTERTKMIDEILKREYSI